MLEQGIRNPELGQTDSASETQRGNWNLLDPNSTNSPSRALKPRSRPVVRFAPNRRAHRPQPKRQIYRL